METLFWVSALVVAYVYAGYPALLAIWARLAGRPVRRRPSFERRNWPIVSVIIAAHNERARLPGRLANLLNQSYPGPVEIVVVSDGSTDDTAAAVGQFGDAVRYIEVARGGKPLALNAGVAAATGSILVFADARQRFSPDAILHLVSNFDDPDVGGVTGELILDCEHDDPTGSTIGDGVGLYWTYEKWLRRHESLIRSTLGATGAIYAIRRVLYEPIPEDTILDDVLIPLRIVRAGYRVLFEPEARAYDGASATAGQEFVRKVRTIAGMFQLLTREIWVFDPFRNAVWFETISHKALRLAMPALQTLVLTANIRLAAIPVYRVVLAAQMLFYAAALMGYLMRGARRPIAIVTLPYTICLLSWATMVGFAHFLMGRQKATWERVTATAAAAMEPVAASAGFVDRRRTVR